MTRRRVVTSTLLAAVSILGLTASRTADPRASASPNSGTYSMRVAPLQLRSIGVMTFGSDGILYVADSRAGAVYAVDVGEATRDTSTSGLMIQGVDTRIAEALGASKDEIRIHDMVAHPLSQSLYFSVTKGRGETETPLIVRLTKQDKRVSVVGLDMIRHARLELPDAASRDTTMPWEGFPRSFTMTHLAVGNGELYIAGLSNEEFKSTLRRATLPFGKTTVTTHVEIYHTSHNRFETASPIESLLPLTLNGRSVVLASYTCSPLVVFDREALTGTGVVRGKTVAELGGGNRPFDMVAYTSPKDGKRYMMIANSHRTLMRFDLADIASAQGMTTAVKQAYQPGGVPYLPVASFGVLELDNYNSQNIVVLERDMANGALDVETVALKWL
ncbi:MAG TPA: hypothetical protein VJO33_15605 [Gemmatimonadaceae bacterium]|nr:hypothetical protein [Gemmatimonadaceae bacterium]